MNIQEENSYYLRVQSENERTVISTTVLKADLVLFYFE